MRTALEQRVLDFIRESRMASAGDRVGVAVSGGADSVALLRVLESLRDELGVALVVVHFDHMLRGEESDRDAGFVEEMARASRLGFVSAREDVRAAAAQNGWNMEEAARRLRYAFFDRVLSHRKATRIAVAHTADDQAETVLAHIIRGTGPTGLASIYPIVESPSGGAIVRPLLPIRRAELRHYLQERKQGWREDATNADQTRLRARIRAQLLPVLESDFSPGIVQHLGDLARFAREEESFWSALVEDRLAKYARQTTGANSDTTQSINAPDLLAPITFGGAAEHAGPHPARALTERLIRRLYEKVRGDRRELSARHVEQVIRLAAESTSGKRLRLPGRIAVERVFDDIVFSRASNEEDQQDRVPSVRETKMEPPSYLYMVDLPASGATTVAVPELSTCFHLKIVDWPLGESDTKTDSGAFDAGTLRSPLLLRSWRPGDAYRPRGHRQSQKLKQMFQAERVPRQQRVHWPVLESAGQVIWARGMAPAEEFCVRENTRVGLLIEEESL
ncbi:MAG: tRNA lysidine(34) synthetase TilS [Candidatus Acidiferrales bacterium]